MPWLFLTLIALGAYLLGSIPSGYLVGKARGVDLQSQGSGNIGATNALRVLGKKWGYLVFAADMVKGALAVRLAYILGGIYWPEYAIPAGILAAFFAMLGHVFPVWLGFKGGKGIATAGGIMIGLFPIWVFLFGVTVWMGLFFGTHYVSIASIAAAVSLPVSSGTLALFGLCDWRLFIVALLMCVLAVWRHKENIQRLAAGTEKRFERKQKVPQT